MFMPLGSTKHVKHTKEGVSTRSDAAPIKMANNVTAEIEEPMPSGGRRSTTWTAETAQAVPRPGRPLGAKDKLPRSAKASIKKIFEEVGSTDPEMIRAAIMRGLQAEPPKSFPYLQLAAAYVDGRPVETVKVEVGMRQVRFAHRFYDGTEDVKTVVVGPREQLDEAAEDDGAIVDGQLVLTEHSSTPSDDTDD